MEQAINAYYNITAESEFKEKVRLLEKARHNETSTLRFEREQAIAEESQKWQDVVANKESIIADKDAEIARLKAQLEKKT